MMVVYQINEWNKRYEVSIKGREPKDGEELRAGALSYIRLKVYGHRQGTGYRRLHQVAGDKGMEVFGIFCKFLEIAGNQPRGKRGFLLNEKDNPATIQDLAFILDIPEQQVKNALDVLIDENVGWLIKTTQHNITQLNSTQGDGIIRKLPETSGNSTSFPPVPVAMVGISERFDEIIKAWNSNVPNRQCGAGEQLAVTRNISDCAGAGISADEMLEAISNYGQAIKLKKSLAGKYKLGSFLRRLPDKGRCYLNTDFIPENFGEQEKDEIEEYEQIMRNAK